MFSKIMMAGAIAAAAIAVSPANAHDDASALSVNATNAAPNSDAARRTDYTRVAARHAWGFRYVRMTLVGVGF